MKWLYILSFNTFCKIIVLYLYIKGNAKSTLQKTHLTLICLFLYLFDQKIILLHLLTSGDMVFGNCSLTFLKDD